MVFVRQEIRCKYPSTFQSSSGIGTPPPPNPGPWDVSAKVTFPPLRPQTFGKSMRLFLPTRALMARLRSP